MAYRSNSLDDAVRFLIDECLSRRLARLVREHGYVGAHVEAFGLRAQPDDVIANYVVESGRILVTNNGRDRRPIYRRFNRHPGLIVILPSVSAGRQIELFSRVLTFIEEQGSVVDRLVQIDPAGNITTQDWAAPDPLQT